MKCEEKTGEEEKSEEIETIPQEKGISEGGATGNAPKKGVAGIGGESCTIDIWV